MSVELTNQYLTFYLSGEQYALNVARVQEVLEMMEPSRLPHMPSYMEGIVNVRDSVLPVVDMRRRFGLESAERTVQTAIVVMELPAEERELTIGGLVDSVDAVVEIDPVTIEPPPEIGTSVDAGYLKGIAKVEGRFVLLLNPANLFSAGEIHAAAAVAAG